MGGEIIDASDEAIADTGEVVGSPTPYKDPVKLNNPKATAGDASRHTGLVIQTHFGHMTHGRIGLFGVHNANPNNKTPPKGAGAQPGRPALGGLLEPGVERHWEGVAIAPPAAYLRRRAATTAR